MPKKSKSIVETIIEAEQRIAARRTAAERRDSIILIVSMAMVAMVAIVAVVGLLGTTEKTTTMTGQLAGGQGKAQGNACMAQCMIIEAPYYTVSSDLTQFCRERCNLGTGAGSCLTSADGCCVPYTEDSDCCVPSTTPLYLRDINNVTDNVVSISGAITLYGGENVAYLGSYYFNGYYADGKVASTQLPLKLQFAKISAIFAGESVTIRYNTAYAKTIYLPDINVSSPTLYVADDGSTYYDSQLTRLAYPSCDLPQAPQPQKGLCCSVNKATGVPYGCLENICYSSSECSQQAGYDVCYTECLPSGAYFKTSNESYASYCCSGTWSKTSYCA